LTWLLFYLIMSVMSNKRNDQGVLISENLVENIREEVPTLTCAHCNNVVVLNPLRKRQRSWCAPCDQYICDSPGCNAECFPYAKMVDKAINQSRQTGKPATGGPFLHRDDGYKQARILMPDGTERIVRQKDVGSGSVVKVL